MLSVTVCHPLEVVRTRLNLQNATASKDKYKGFINAFKLIWKEEGWHGFYRGNEYYTL